MRWLLILVALVSCRAEDAAYPRRMEPIPDRVAAAVRITGTTECERTPPSPGGVLDIELLETYVKEMSARLEICADKVATLNERIKRARRQR